LRLSRHSRCVSCSLFVLNRLSVVRRCAVRFLRCPKRMFLTRRVRTRKSQDRTQGGVRCRLPGSYRRRRSRQSRRER
jgi:hypothetical protein